MRIRTILFGAILLTSANKASAIIDANGNNMSDVWEKAFNGNALFSTSNPALQTDADADGDGVSNVRESIAGTDPFSGALPAGWLQATINPHPSTFAVFTLSWPSIAGKDYQIFTSDDLVEWVPFGEVVPGTDAAIQFAIDARFEDGSAPERLFWRIKVKDQDPDGDSLTTSEELALGYDPEEGDTDFDGIRDNLDPSPLISATTADPDGANLTSALEANLRAFYDFETTTGTFPYLSIPDRSGNGRDATTFLSSITLPGMPSKSGAIASTYVKAPVSAVNVTTWSISGWLRMEKDSLKDAAVDSNGNSNARTLYAIFERTGQTGTGVKLGKGHGLFLRKTNQGETWFIGSYIQDIYFNEPPNTNGNPKTVLSGANFNLPLGTTDDGGWHHFVVTRGGGTGGSGSRLYLDGSLVLTTGLNEQSVNYTSANTALTFGRLHPDQPSFRGTNGGFVDRVRVHGRVLSASDVSAYYRQDIDRDGLWDVTETNTALWRDANSNAVKEASEYSYVSSPYRWQDPATSDIDGDGLLDIAEQTLGTKTGSADTDGDLLPDGWEVENGLDPKNPNGGNGKDGNPDGDAWTNIDEYRFATGANNAASGGPPSIPSDERVSILLAIGDQSGSHSEDYVMNCFEIGDNGAEKRVYTLRSGGFGEYKEETQNLFRKGKSYTFQIQWNGTNNDVEEGGGGVAAEGADFDYTFKVQPQGSHGGVLIDSYDPKTRTLDEENPILAVEANDVATTKDEFESNFQSRRVALANVKLQWEAFPGFDNISNHVDPWTNAVKGKRIFPDAADPTLSAIRHKVKVVASGGLPGLSVFLRAFDIDDSTSTGFDTASEIDTNGSGGSDNLPDYLSTEKTGHFWEGGAWGDYYIDKKLDAAGRAEFDFRVGMQPGNNYRIVAAVKNATPLAGAQGATPASPGYIGPELSQNGGLAATEPLTVWRRLWVENDSMEGPGSYPNGLKKNDLSASLTNPTISNVQILSGENLTRLSLPAIDDQDSATNLQAEYGSIVVDLTKFDVARSGHPYYVDLTGTSLGISAGDQFRLYDDDDFGLDREALPRLDLLGDGLMASIYKNAFIEVVDAANYNPRKLVEFYRNHPVLVGPWPPSLPGVWNDSIDLEDSNEAWVANVIAGYQGGVDEDNDPDDGGGLFGGTPEGREYSVVYVEVCRDFFNNALRNRPDENAATNHQIRTEISQTTAHELGHMPGGGTGESHHAEEGFMGDGSSNSVPSPKTMKRFRSTLKWKQP